MQKASIIFAAIAPLWSAPLNAANSGPLTIAFRPPQIICTIKDPVVWGQPVIRSLVLRDGANITNVSIEFSPQTYDAILAALKLRLGKPTFELSDEGLTRWSFGSRYIDLRRSADALTVDANFLPLS